MVYIRYPLSDFFFLLFLAKAKRKKVRVIIEFPTFPYDIEFKNKSLLKKAGLLVDKFFRQFIQYFVKDVVTYTEIDSIYGIPAVKINNGIDIDSIKLKIEKTNDQELHLLAVANLSFWQGYDRIIKGLIKYYQTSINLPVFLHIVGEGPEYESYKTLVLNANILDKVIFYGLKNPDELNYFYDIADIGISSLGVHRKNIKSASPLKSREFCAVGLPFIYAYDDDDFNDNFPYTLKLPADDSLIDVEQIIEFYEHIKAKNLIKNMNAYAIKKFSWSAKLKPILEK